MAKVTNRVEGASHEGPLLLRWKGGATPSEFKVLSTLFNQAKVGALGENELFELFQSGLKLIETCPYETLTDGAPFLDAFNRFLSERSEALEIAAPPLVTMTSLMSFLPPLDPETALQLYEEGDSLFALRFEEDEKERLEYGVAFAHFFLQNLDSLIEREEEALERVLTAIPEEIETSDGDLFRFAPLRQWVLLRHYSHLFHRKAPVSNETALSFFERGMSLLGECREVLSVVDEFELIPHFWMWTLRHYDGLDRPGRARLALKILSTNSSIGNFYFLLHLFERDEGVDLVSEAESAKSLCQRAFSLMEEELEGISDEEKRRFCVAFTRWSARRMDQLAMDRASLLCQIGTFSSAAIQGAAVLAFHRELFDLDGGIEGVYLGASLEELSALFLEMVQEHKGLLIQGDEERFLSTLRQWCKARGCWTDELSNLKKEIEGVRGKGDSISKV